VSCFSSSFDVREHNAEFLWLDALHDSAKVLEQLLSKEVNDVSAQMPESVEELLKVNGELRKVIEDKDKQLEDQQKDNHALRKEIEELKEALLLATKK